MITRRILGYIAIVGTAVMPAMANAGITCRGPVQKIIIGYGSSDVEIDWGFNQIKLCNVNHDVTRPYATPITITKETCQNIVGQALTAFGTGKDFGVYINAAITDCMLIRDTTTGWIVDPGPQRIYVFNCTPQV